MDFVANTFYSLSRTERRQMKDLKDFLKWIDKYLSNLIRVRLNSFPNSSGFRRLFSGDFDFVFIYGTLPEMIGYFSNFREKNFDVFCFGIFDLRKI